MPWIPSRKNPMAMLAFFYQHQPDPSWGMIFGVFFLTRMFMSELVVDVHGAYGALFLVETARSMEKLAAE